MFKSTQENIICNKNISTIKNIALYNTNLCIISGIGAVESGSNSSGSAFSQGHYVVFLGKTHYSHSGSLHQGV